MALVLVAQLVQSTADPARAYFRVTTTIVQSEPEQAPLIKAIADPDQPPIVEIATAPTSRWSSLAVYKRTSRNAAMWLTWIAASLLLVFNVVLIGHFRRTYRPVRRRRPA